MDFLADYELKVKYPKGPENGAADFLSRKKEAPKADYPFDEGEILGFDSKKEE